MSNIAKYLLSDTNCCLNYGELVDRIVQKAHSHICGEECENDTIQDLIEKHHTEITQLQLNILADELDSINEITIDNQDWIRTKNEIIEGLQTGQTNNDVAIVEINTKLDNINSTLDTKIDDVGFVTKINDYYDENIANRFLNISNNNGLELKNINDILRHVDEYYIGKSNKLSDVNNANDLYIKCHDETVEEINKIGEIYLKISDYNEYKATVETKFNNYYDKTYVNSNYYTIEGINVLLKSQKDYYDQKITELTNEINQLKNKDIELNTAIEANTALDNERYDELVEEAERLDNKIEINCGELTEEDERLNDRIDAIGEKLTKAEENIEILQETTVPNNIFELYKDEVAEDISDLDKKITDVSYDLTQAQDNIKQLEDHVYVN